MKWFKRKNKIPMSPVAGDLHFFAFRLMYLMVVNQKLA